MSQHIGRHRHHFPRYRDDASRQATGLRVSFIRSGYRDYVGTERVKRIF